MSELQSVGVPLLTVIVSVAGGWFVSSRVADHWDQIKKNREMSFAMAQDFQRLFGEMLTIWKSWNAFVEDRATASSAERTHHHYFERATAVEGQLEALLAKVSAERLLTEDQVDVLGSIRVAFKVIRRTIGRAERVEWVGSDTKPLRALKALTAATSVLLAAPHDGRPRESVAVRNFIAITNPRHGENWWLTAHRLAPEAGIDSITMRDFENST